MIDPGLASALEKQLADWHATLHTGAERLGWKLGVGDRESIGGEIAVGHLTSATCLPPGTSYRAPDDAVELHADAELAVELGRDIGSPADAAAVLAAIGGYGVALEIVDLAPLQNEPESVVAANIFHRAVAFGPMLHTLPRHGLVGKLLVGDEIRASGRAADDVVEKLSAAARILGAVGERLEAGDLIITGSIVQVPVMMGDEVTAAIEELGEVRLSIAPYVPSTA
ncbi:MAG: fumarylacetoacetate hydrolase family protein [Gemmatimonadota bacterium]|nr:fumarylacetoacetate hydrolase family protein [Gemmatimonadota bacterium]